MMFYNQIRVQFKKKRKRIFNEPENQQMTQDNSLQQGLGWFEKGAIMGIQWVQQQRMEQKFEISSSENIFQNCNLGKVIEEQIVFMEPSPAEKKLQQIRKQGGVFIDERFPHNLKSLTGEWGHLPEWKNITWKRISEIISKPEIFVGRIEPNDIKQGYLGDCYFLAGLAALAECPDRIFNLFLLNELNKEKYFQVKMLYKGKWLTIDMDEYIPVLHNEPAFSKARDKQLWVILLEKAWAKLYTSYKRIQAGYPEEALHDLTGAPIKQISLGYNFNKENQWQYLMMASQRRYAMVTSSQPGSDSNKSVSGVVQGHAYTLIKVDTLNFKGNQERLVKLRNPWGKSQATSAWSDNDSRWNLVSPQDKARLGYSMNSHDGTFFMSYDAFVKEFRAITIAEINDNASYVYLSHKDPQNKGCYFKLQVRQNGYYSLQVDKTPERHYPEKIQDRFKYPKASLDICQFNCQTKQTFKLEGASSTRRTLFKQYQLQCGVYIVCAKIDYDQKLENEFDVNLAVYSEVACQIHYASREQACALANRNVDWTPSNQNSSQDGWNNLGNIDYGNNNLWISNLAEGIQGNLGGLNYGNSNNSWGNNQPNQDDGWGNNNNGNGWGQIGNSTGNNGWGNQGNNNNNGWGNQNNNNSNNGWGNQANSGGNNGWGNQGNSGGNNGWGNQQDNNGWGNQAINSGNNGGNNGGNNSWGNQQGNNGGNNNGWGQQPNNNGWGNGW